MNKKKPKKEDKQPKKKVPTLGIGIFGDNSIPENKRADDPMFKYRDDQLNWGG